MSYDFYVLLPGEPEPLLIETASYNLSPVDDAIGGITWSMPTGDPKYPGILDAIKQGEFPFEIWSGGVRQQFLCGWTEGLAQVLTDDNGRAVAQAFSGRFSGVIMDWAKIMPNAVPNVTYLPSTASTAGLFLKGILDFLVANHWVDAGKIIPTFNAVRTSDGKPWARKSAMQFNFAGHIWEAMDQMQSAGLVSWRVRAGDNGAVYVDGFNEAQDGQDVSARVRLTRGANVKSSTRELRHDDKVGTGIWVKTSNAAVDVVLEDALARSRKPVSKLVLDERADIFDKKTALAYAAAKLPYVIKLNPQIEIRGVQLSTAHPDYVADTPVPGRDFWTGDFISLWEPDSIHLESGQSEGDSTGTGQWRRYKVKQITLAVGAGGVAISYDLVLGNVFRDPRVPAAPATVPTPAPDPGNKPKPTGPNDEPIPTPDEKQYLPTGGPGVLETTGDEQSASWTVNPTSLKSITMDQGNYNMTMTPDRVDWTNGEGNEVHVLNGTVSGGGGETLSGFRVDQNIFGANHTGYLAANSVSVGNEDAQISTELNVRNLQSNSPEFLLQTKKLMFRDQTQIDLNVSLNVGDILRKVGNLQTQIDNLPPPVDPGDGGTGASTVKADYIIPFTDPGEGNNVEVIVAGWHLNTINDSSGTTSLIKPPSDNGQTFFQYNTDFEIQSPLNGAKIQINAAGTITLTTPGVKMVLGSTKTVQITAADGGPLTDGFFVSGQMWMDHDGDGTYEKVDTQGL